MKKRALYLILPIITLILEVLPYGAVLVFSDGVQTYRETMSYFDLTAFGYANFAPFLTALFTCVILLLLVIYCFWGKERFVTGAKKLLVAAAVISFGPLLYGIRFFSAVGLLISLSLIAEALLIHFTLKTPHEESSQ